MFGPTASPVVQCQSTWHIGPTTWVFASRSLARFESDGIVGRREEPLHRGQLGRDPARERDRLAPRRADEARRARDPVVQHVRADRPGRERAARHRRGQPALGVRERDAHRLGRAAGLDHLAVVRQLVRAELDLDRRRRDRDHGHADQRLGRGGEGLEVDRGDMPPSSAHRLAARLDRAASFFRGQRMGAA